MYLQYLLTAVEGALADLLSLSLLAPGQCVQDLRSTISRFCVDLLPELIGLTDAFGFSDWELDRSVRLSQPRFQDEQ